MIRYRLFLWLLATCVVLTLPAKVKAACVGNSITYGYGTANPLPASTFLTDSLFRWVL